VKRFRRSTADRLSAGTIVFVESKYIFTGYIYGNELATPAKPLGLKIMIFPAARNTREIQPLTEPPIPKQQVA
jgi:hypothetical protein